MLNRLHSSRGSDILTKAEKKRFKNYHLPLFVCPSCGTITKDGTINTMGSPCVNCGYSVELGEFRASSLKQFRKQKFAFKLNIKDLDHQQIIADFRDNVLWQCDQCGKHNLNLPKTPGGDPNTHANIGCGGCGHPYEHGGDLLPFWALKGFGFDDGDDSSNTYELKKLGESQLLWLQAIAKAQKTDRKNGAQERSEVNMLQQGLEAVKRRARNISGGRWKDGTAALRYIEGYLLGEGVAKKRKLTRQTKDYVKGVLDTNSRYNRTPIKDDSNILQDYLYNLLHLDVKTLFGTGATTAAALLAFSAIAKGEYTVGIEEVYHTARLEQEVKGTLNLSYRLHRREPEYNEESEEVEYRRVEDDDGRSKYNMYASRAQHYRLETIGRATEESNGFVDLDTGEDRDVWVSQVCPTVDDDFGTSSGSYTGGGSSHTPSTGMGHDGNGGLFYRPTEEEMRPDGYEDYTYNPNITQRVFTASSDILGALLGVSAAHAATDCGYWTSEDIEVSAERFVTVQNYRVWDWKNSTWYSSAVTAGTDYTQSFENLQTALMNDPENQRIIDGQLVMEVDISDEEGNISRIPVSGEEMWLEIAENIGSSCEISISYLNKWMRGIRADDIIEQCIQEN